MPIGYKVVLLLLLLSFTFFWSLAIFLYSLILSIYSYFKSLKIPYFWYGKNRFLIELKGFFLHALPQILSRNRKMLLGKNLETKLT